MDLDRLTAYIPKIELSLAREYERARRSADAEFREYFDALHEFALRGGKRFRALLVLAGYHLASGRPPEPALPAAAALEHFQSWMLVHDDVIDRALERRGGPALHRRFASEHQARSALGDPEQYGIGLAITLGDLEEPFTIQGILAAKVAAPRRMAALTEYSRMAHRTALGQALDIRNGSRLVSEVSERDVLLVHELKSAIYTVASPLRIGAILGGATPGLLNALERFGIDAGIAFQLRDDILGTGFDASDLGKSANDLVEGKRTLLVVRAWHAADGAGRTQLTGVLGNPGSTPAQVEGARDLIRSTGSLAYSETKIHELSDRALRGVAKGSAIPKRGRPLLAEIAHKLVDRRT
ncbi:MAG: polyprenyl synthetase family protein [Thermoplasmata archaeon]|nr:polyprenyl synthetase family protein [Thermoplasmata archaeon]